MLINDRDLMTNYIEFYIELFIIPSGHISDYGAIMLPYGKISRSRHQARFRETISHEICQIVVNVSRK
jgi:hypothetical protein